MKLYLAQITDVLPSHVNLLDERRAQKAERYKKTDDKKRCIAGGLLLRKFLGGAKITENEFGKPVAEGGICFNLSHSGDYALLALDSAEIGCDIEQVRFVKAEKTGKYVFGENEMSLIKNAPDKTGAFFRLWTKKESLLKCMGKGFHREAKTVDVSGNFFDDNGKKYYLKTWEFSDYVISVCSETSGFTAEIEFVRLSDENFF